MTVFTSELDAVYVNQSDWSGGPGVSGPVTLYWDDTFSSEYHTSYYTIPGGKLLLDISSSTHVISTGMGGCWHAFPADMDGDGDTDVLASDAGSGSLYWMGWFENDGTGGGWAVHTVSENYPVYKCVYPADMDNDGDMDIVSTNPAVGELYIEWWRNDDGIGETWTKFIIADDTKTFFVCAEDIDGDSLPDVAAPLIESGSTDNIEWWGSLTSPPDSLWETHLVYGAMDRGEELFLIDLDQDGDMDIISACWEQHGLYWWENLDGEGLSWTGHEIGNAMSFATSCHAADIDGDGDYDVVYSDSEHEEVEWCENLNGSGTSWARHLLDDEFWPEGVHAVDVTDDGHTDIIAAVRYAIYLYRNIDGSGDEWVRISVNQGSWFMDVDDADFNGDGRTDILSSALNNYEVSWHEISGYSSGWLESSILDVYAYPQWDSIAWTAEEPVDTDLFFQMRSSNDWEDMGNWCDSIFEPSSLVGVIDSTHRYIQYRVGMTAENEFDTPILDEIRFYWTYLGIEGGEGDIEFSLTAAPNPSMGAVSILVPPLFSEDVQLLVYDISGKVVAELLGGEGNVFQWDCRDSSGSTVPSGIYIIQGIVGDKSTSVRFVKL